MEKISVAQARQVEAVGKQVRLDGWVRTRRDSKGGFSFLELNDGSCFGNVQVIADGKLPNYESEIKKLHVGSSVRVEGKVKASPAKGQAHRGAGVERPCLRFLRRGNLSLAEETDLLRVPAHHRDLRPRTNTFGATTA